MTQNERVRRHLESFGAITTYEAFQDYGITRLPARIWDLRHKYQLLIGGTRKTAKNRFDEPVWYMVYTMEKEKEE